MQRTDHRTAVPRSRLALSALLLTACGQSPEQMVTSAKEYLAKNDRNAAMIQLKNALQENPNLAEARLLLGRSQLQAGDLAAAEKELRKALELKVPAEQVAPALAQVLVAQGQPKKAIDEFGTLQVADAAGKAELQTALGNAYLATGNAEAANTAFAAALSAKPDYGRAMLGQAYAKAGATGSPWCTGTGRERRGQGPETGRGTAAEGRPAARAGRTGQGDRGLPRGAGDQGQLPAGTHVHRRSTRGRGQARRCSQGLGSDAKGRTQTSADALPQGDARVSEEGLRRCARGNPGVLQVAPDYLPGLLLSGAIDYELKAYAQAETSLTKVLQRAPNAGFARRVLAATYLRERQPAQALDTLKPLLEGGQVDAGLAALAGEVFLQNGNSGGGVALFRDGLPKIDPKSTPARTAVALTHMAKGDTDRAFKELEDTAAADTGTRADLALIATSMRKRDYDRALAAVDALEKKQPDNPLAQNLRGGVMLAKRDVPAARKSFEKALMIDKGYLPAAANLARLDLVDKKPDDAKKRFEGVLEKDPKSVQALLGLAELRAQAGGSADEVAALISKAIAANPKELTPRLALIGLYLKNQDTKKAINAANDGLSALPDNPELTHALGRAQQAAGDTEAALTTFNKLAQLQPGSPLPWIRIAEAQMQAKNNSAAMQSLKKVLTIKPDLVEAQVALMRLEIADGRPKEALTMARDIQRQRPTQPVGFMLEGDVHASQKAWKEALAAYRAGLKVAPDSVDAAASSIRRLAFPAPARTPRGSRVSGRRITRRTSVSAALLLTCCSRAATSRARSGSTGRSSRSSPTMRWC